MALSAHSRAFRDQPINDHTEVIFEQSEIYDESNSFDSSSLKNAMYGGNNKEAINNGLDQISENKFPIDENARSEAALAIIDAMLGCKSLEIKNFVGQKSMPELDILMMIVYKGLAHHEDLSKSKILFTWHKAIEEKAGVGCILRTLNSKCRL